MTRRRTSPGSLANGHVLPLGLLDISSACLLVNVFMMDVLVEVVVYEHNMLARRFLFVCCRTEVQSHAHPAIQKKGFHSVQYSSTPSLSLPSQPQAIIHRYVCMSCVKKRQ